MLHNILVNMERQRYPNSGLGYYCRCLEKGLRELQAKTCEISYYRPRQGDETDVEKYNVLHKVFNPKTSGYEGLHITHQLDRYFNYCFKTKKCIVTLHDLNFIRENHPKSKEQRLFAWCRRNLERADVIVCISEFVREDLLRHKHLFHLKESVEIEVIHNGILFEEKRAEFEKSPFPQLEGQDYLLAIGVLHYKKQQHRMLEMLPFLPEEMKLVLVYSDEKKSYYNQILDTIARLNLNKRVIFLENIANEEKHYLIRNAKALVHPSIAEGFGIPPIEAMAEGKPVFLSRETSLPEVGGEEAFYFNKGDNAEGLAQTLLDGLKVYEQDKEKAQRLKAWAMTFDYRVMAQKYLDLYLRVLAE